MHRFALALLLAVAALGAGISGSLPPVHAQSSAARACRAIGIATTIRATRTTCVEARELAYAMSDARSSPPIAGTVKVHETAATGQRGFMIVDGRFVGGWRCRLRVYFIRLGEEEGGPGHGRCTRPGGGLVRWIASD